MRCAAAPRLSYDSDVEDIALGPYLQAVCADAISSASHCKLDFEAAGEIKLDADRAISLALIINELITNAAKYAFPDRSDGQIWVRLGQANENTALISVRDDGVGLPAGFDVSNSRGLGMRIVAGLSKQLGAIISHRGDVNGTEFALLVPLQRLTE
jgi:two-component sensor histidine kinase